MKKISCTRLLVYSLGFTLLGITSHAFSKEAKISNGDFINLRTAPSVSSRVIRTLRLHESITIISSDAKYTLTGNFYGRWVKIMTAQKETGYTLSCFLDKSAEPVEPFHVFLPLFARDVKHYLKTKQSTGLFPCRVTFPLLQTTDGGPNASHLIPTNKIDENQSLFMSDIFPEKTTYRLRQDKIDVLIGPGVGPGPGADLLLNSFQLRNNRWYLVQVHSSII